MSDNVMDDFIPDTDISVQQILNNLLSGDVNLDLKTEIRRPQQISALKTFTYVLKKEGLETCSKALKLYLNYYLRSMVSYNRLSRKEVIEALKGLLEYEKQKEMGNPLSRNLIK